MKITREDQANGSALINVVIEQKDYEKNVADKLREYRMKASLPGFRPGKVPASLIEKRFAKPVLLEEVNNLLSNSLNNYMQEEKISILGDPLPHQQEELKIDWDNDKEFSFAFDIAISPEVKIDLENGHAFDYYRIRVDQQMLEESIESIRTRYGTNVETDLVSEKSSVRGDFVQLDEEGNPVENGIAPKGVLIAVDLLKDEAVKAEFLSKKAGDTLRFDPVTALGDRHEVGHMLNISHEEADTLNSTFSFTIASILDFTKAELNEELFLKVYGAESGISTLEQFKEKIAEEITLNLAHSSNQKFAVDTRESLINNIAIDLPEPFLKRWLREVNKEMTDDQIEQDFPNFTRDLRWQLIKNSIIRDHELTVTEDEISSFARQIAISQYQQYGIYQVQEEHLDVFVKKILEKEEDRERIVRRIFDDKVISTVREKAPVVEKEVSSDEFRAMVETNEEL
ncbi:MAG TPA: trigger factor [Prolixibacteraceae bacterium]|nr:trigger factor [Prolixibacteraceae bacterium]HPT30416.1 trigger factor [Prolixibacteraceae bacterium]